MKKKVARVWKNPLLDKIRRETSLLIRIKVLLQVIPILPIVPIAYLGDLDKKLLEPILKEVEEWLNDKAPLR